MQVVVLCLIGRSVSLSKSGLHIRNFSGHLALNGVSTIRNNVQHNNIPLYNTLTLRGRRNDGVYTPHLGCHAFTHETGSYSAAKPSVNPCWSIPKDYVPPSIEDSCKDAEGTLDGGILATRELIRSLKSELSSLEDHDKCISKLVSMGSKIFKDAPEPSVMRVPPRSLSDINSFRLPVAGNDSVKYRNYFVYKLPVDVDYKLVTGCVASIFVAVHVDGTGIVYVDGTSDSLITKAILSLIIDSVALKSVEDVLQVTASDVGHESVLGGLGFMKRDGVGSILSHIKSEVRAQSASTTVAPQLKLRPSIMKKRRIAMLLSGGVDSSIALWSLKSRGYDVEAFYLKVWGVANDDDMGTCQWASDVEHAMDVCKRLEVPLHILPFQDLYHERVLDPYIEGTRLGETPNPDVCCNEFIKFGVFLDYATRWGFSHVASGHYASVFDDTCTDGFPGKVTRLRLCKDLSKDQTYFLSRLSQSQLQRVLFPLNGLLKSEVREIARTLCLSNHDRKDSVGLCFLGKVNVRSFLSERLGRCPGPIVDCESMKRVGEHPGLYHFTIGQREGIAQYLSSVRETYKLRHVVGKDVGTNTLYVSSCYHTGRYVDEGGIRRRFFIRDITWNIPDYHRYILCGVDGERRLSLKLRHSPNFATGKIEFNSPAQPTGATVNLDRADVGLATGQYAVFYAGNDCIGAGKIVASAD
ncbi:tRNA-specific 2-thiouridylase MnmA [Babesia sp. Xinjiang]|uniref:tRNA-specific 2-thiouridylase MnmA n=1 Tax=Babesia sp. Xinjiang TaxID=462227 RepID=UPI000A226EF6|nr:tRNA-specific 2-thiouridylase MnmA [Babesia sp. Xinjiang]ORM41958.1 tRNA-specific 2-thiouridylase MnmA [Babesia sp. Xinjiang]